MIAQRDPCCQPVSRHRHTVETVRFGRQTESHLDADSANLMFNLNRQKVLKFVYVCIFFRVFVSQEIREDNTFEIRENGTSFLEISREGKLVQIKYKYRLEVSFLVQDERQVHLGRRHEGRLPAWQTAATQTCLRERDTVRAMRQRTGETREEYDTGVPANCHN